MPVPLQLPPQSPYQSPVNFVASRLLHEPDEGRRVIPFGIRWGDYPAGNAVLCSASFNNTLDISQLVTIQIDNSQCSSDVIFYFPDTGLSYTVDAAAPAQTFNVSTGQTSFYIMAPTAKSSDVTNWACLNFFAMPYALSVTPRQTPAAVAGIAAAVGDTQIIADTISGTLEVAFVFVDSPADVNGQNAFQLIDGTGAVLGQANFGVSNNTQQNLTPLQLGSVNIPFKNGVKLHQTRANSAQAVYSVNTYYKVP